MNAIDVFTCGLRNRRCDLAEGREWIIQHGGEPCGSARLESWALEFPSVSVTAFWRDGPHGPEWGVVYRIADGCRPADLPWQEIRDRVIQNYNNTPCDGWGLSRGPGCV